MARTARKDHHPFRRAAIPVIGVCLAFSLLANPSLASEPPDKISTDALQGLAREFVQRIGTRLKKHEAAASAEKNAPDALSLIPDGEVLLLRPKAGKFVIDREIAALRHDGAIYYALRDLIDQLELPIDYDEELKTGAGWFLREDWLIRFDFMAGEVVSRGQRFSVSGKDVYMAEGQRFISEGAAKAWLEIETKPDLPQQYVEITTPVPFPALARNLRERDTRGQTARNEAVLPRKKTDHQWLDINLAEIQQDVRVRSTSEDGTNTTHRNITSIQGDALKHNLYAVGFWDDEDQLNSVRARLTKEEEDGTLLGPLRARSYTLGDTDLAQLPLTGNSTQEFGVRVNNNPLRNADFQDTTIGGDSLPGWDVELYRDGVLIDRIRVGEDARYEFQDVQLFAGDNTFEVFFYGPQGEIRRDNFNIPVNEQFLATQDGTYDVSVSFSETQTYTKFESEDEDAQTPHIVARYNKLIGDTLTYAGVRTRQEEGEQKAYLGAGFTNALGGFLFDGNAAADEQGASAGELSVRKNIDDWKLSLRGRARDEDYEAGGEDQNVYSVLADANRNFRTPFNTFATVNANALYGKRPDDSTQTGATLGLSHQKGRLNISNTTTYEKINMPDGEEMDATINNFLSARMNFGKVFTRAGIDMNVEPERKIDGYFGQVSYQPSRAIGADLLVEHDPDADFSEGRLTVNYRHDKFRLSPFVNVDTNSEWEAGVKLITTLVDTPGKTLPELSGERLIGRGLVSSYVFHDKNGNMIFDSGDAPLPGVMVESVNTSRRAATNDAGYSLIRDLPESFVTDIRVDASTLPDPFMIPAAKGVSIFPKAGQMVKLSFPVHLAGEIDGVVDMASGTSKTPLAGAGLLLVPTDGRSSEPLQTFSAGDGFYVFSNVPPGDYLFMMDPKSKARTRAAAGPPRALHIGYDGTVMSGLNLTLNKDAPRVPVEIRKHSDAAMPAFFAALEIGGGEEKTGLSKILTKIMEKRAGLDAEAGLTPLILEGSENLKTIPGGDWNTHYDRCEKLSGARISCRLVFFLYEKKDERGQAIARNAHGAQNIAKQ